MSASGARIEESSCDPLEGERVALRLCFLPGSLSVEIPGRVVRKTETCGFCVHFVDLQPRTRQLLVRLLPKVSTLRSDSEEQVSTYSGQMLVRIGAEVQQACLRAAEGTGVTLDTWIAKQLKKAASGELESALEDATRGHDPSTCPDCLRQASKG